jgi:hypothetical protein
VTSDCLRGLRCFQKLVLALVLLFPPLSMSDSDCIDEVVATKTRTQSESIEKFSNDPSTSTPIPTQTSSPPSRSTFKSIILVLTVTFAMIINVGGLQWPDALFLKKPTIIDRELFSIYNSPTNHSERVGLG